MLSQQHVKAAMTGAKRLSYKNDPSIVGIAARLLEKQDAEIARLTAELETARALIGMLRDAAS